MYLPDRATSSESALWECSSAARRLRRTTCATANLCVSTRGGRTSCRRTISAYLPTRGPPVLYAPNTIPQAPARQKAPNAWTTSKCQIRIRSMPRTAGQALSSKLMASLVRSYNLVIRGDSWFAICCTRSIVPPFWRGVVMPVARNIWQQVVAGRRQGRRCPPVTHENCVSPLSQGCKKPSRRLG